MNEFTFRQYRILRELARSWDGTRSRDDERDTGLDCCVFGFGSMPIAETVAELINRDLDGQFEAEVDMFSVIVRLSR